MAAFVSGLLKKYGTKHFSKITPEESYYTTIRRLIWGYRFSAVFSILVTSIFAYIQILWLRIFVNQSEWIKLNPNHQNPEDYYGNIGQLVPLSSMISIVITFAKELWSRERNSTLSKDLQNVDHGEGQLSSSLNNNQLPTRTDHGSEQNSISPPRKVHFGRIETVSSLDSIGTSFIHRKPYEEDHREVWQAWFFLNKMEGH